MTTYDDVKRVSNVIYLPVKRHNPVWQSGAIVAGVLALVLCMWAFVSFAFSFS